MNTTKRIFALGAACAMTLSLTACGNNGGTGSTTDGDTQNITLCLDWTPNTNHTGFYAAQALGYYEEAGINLTIVQPPEDGAVSVCASGQADFTIDAQDTLAAAFALDEPLSVTAVATLLQHNTSGIISRKGDGIDTPAGLTGHTYSTWNSPIELAMLNKLVNDNGGNWDDVALIPNTITDEAAGLTEKQTDAIWIFYGWGGINAELAGLDFDYWNFADIDPTFDYYTPLLIGNNTFLENNPELTTAFLSATAKGYEYAIENPDEAAQMLIDGDDTGSLTGSKDMVYASQEWISKQYIADAEKWGYIDPTRWNTFYNWLNDNNLVATPIPENYGFNNSYLA